MRGPTWVFICGCIISSFSLALSYHIASILSSHWARFTTLHIEFAFVHTSGYTLAFLCLGLNLPLGLQLVGSLRHLGWFCHHPLGCAALVVWVLMICEGCLSRFSWLRFQVGCVNKLG
jgi:hypothetical protein